MIMSANRSTTRRRTTMHQHAIRKAILLSLVIAITLTTSFVLARRRTYSSSSSLPRTSSSSNTRGGISAQRIKKWQLYQHQRYLVQKIHDDDRDRLQLYKTNWRESQRRYLQQIPVYYDKDDNDIESYTSQTTLKSNNDQILEHKQQKSQQIKLEIEQQSTIYATIQRSLKEKYHIQWQLNQVKLQQQKKNEKKKKKNRASLLFPLQPSYEYETTNSDEYPQFIIDNNNLHHHRHHHHSATTTTINNQQHHRKLEDAFDNAYNQNKPGSTYGTNMFCGTSWADASTSCESRQNCPSGQSSECIMPGHECWAFTECDTRYGHGEEFSEFHNVEGASNLQASGVGAVESGGYVDLNKPSPDKTDHYFCGRGYDDAISKCSTHCPSGSLNDCPEGEICFFNTPCDARMMTRAPAAPSPTGSPTTPSPVVHENKLNKYFCGYDWDDAQQR